MTKTSRRPGQPDAGIEKRRHEELIQITCEIFAEKGFDGASLQDIADRFGILKGSLFHYIQSKNDLLYEIIEGVYVGAESAIWSIVKEEGGATERLRRLIVAYVTYIAEHQSWVTVWLHDLNALEANSRRKIMKYEERDRGRLTQLIAEATAEGAFRADSDPQIIAFALLGAMNWVHRWYRPGRLSPAEVGEMIADLYIRDGAHQPVAAARTGSGAR